MPNFMELKITATHCRKQGSLLAGLYLPVEPTTGHSINRCSTSMDVQASLLWEMTVGSWWGLFPNLRGSSSNSSSWISIGGGPYSPTLPILNILSLRNLLEYGESRGATASIHPVPNVHNYPLCSVYDKCRRGAVQSQRCDNDSDNVVVCARVSERKVCATPCHAAVRARQALTAARQSLASLAVARQPAQFADTATAMGQDEDLEKLMGHLG
ncbi:hypothetical protein J6590_021424 [Homalodisca vitripennis]|nr:hypothetical protein J6590_021424 [Homalodisca vitripennis]